VDFPFFASCLEALLFSLELSQNLRLILDLIYGFPKKRFQIEGFGSSPE
jgi:hypothetical protein